MIHTILKYRKRLSGPLLDRIDLHIDVAPVEEEKLTADTSGTASEDIRKKVIHANEIQKKRFQHVSIHKNGEMSPKHIKEFCVLTQGATHLLKQAVLRLFLSARVYFKTIKVAQTIADLEGLEHINDQCIAEALSYRAKDE